MCLVHSTSVYAVDSITASPTEEQELSFPSYVRVLKITTTEGNVLEIKVFANNAASLQLHAN